MTSIISTLGTYIDKVEPIYWIMAYVHICVEVNLKNGIPEAIQLALDDYKHIQPIEYMKFPF